jgi:ABC-2 type transport system ATP-binding protein
LLGRFTPPLEKRIRQYSTGNKQMLAIVQAFIDDPDLLVVDEPTSGRSREGGSGAVGS